MGKKRKKAGIDRITHYEGFRAYYENRAKMLRPLNVDEGKPEELIALDDLSWLDGWEDLEGSSDKIEFSVPLNNSRNIILVATSNSTIDMRMRKFVEFVVSGKALKAANLLLDESGPSVTEIDFRKEITDFDYGYTMEHALKSGMTTEELIEDMKATGDTGYFANWIYSFFHIGHFLKNGSRIFKVTDNLSNVFAEMECSYPKNLLRTPYLSQYIQIPVQKIPGVENSESLGFDGAYVYRDSENQHIDIFMMQPFTSKSFGASFESFVEELQREGKQKKMVGEYVPSLRISLVGEDMNLDELILEWSKNNVHEGEDPAIAIRLRGLLNSVLRMIIHTLLYATSSSVGQVSIVPSKNQDINPRDYRRHLDTIHTEMPYVELGGDIKIQPRRVSGNGSSTGRHLNARFTVRAHFSHYWYLKENIGDDVPIVSTTADGCKVMIRKFVESYWKGPDTAEKVLRDYVV